ncbi:MAG: energy-coupling factor transporter transmembrane protein EcfT [Chloroflexi bacterium]|nr:energy-coupling factor transporter transmembrane protein EcfT [Chloroflexota bacterium]
MENWDILRNITIGQYLPTGSFVHHLDPRVKLICFALIVGAVTFTGTYLGNAVLLVVAFALIALSKIPMRYALGGLVPAIPIVLFLGALQILLYTPGFAGRDDCVVFFEWGVIVSNTCGVQLAMVSAARFVELLILTSLLTFSTTTAQLTLGTERLLSPLQRVNFPAHEIALTLTIALRFVPTFAEELERIVKAQVSRGADLGEASRWQFAQQMRYLLPLVVPLFLSALRRAEDLALAMEARGYVGGKGRTHLIAFHATRSDFISLLVTIAFSILLLVFPFAF